VKNNNFSLAGETVRLRLELFDWLPPCFGVFREKGEVEKPVLLSVERVHTLPDWDVPSIYCDSTVKITKSEGVFRFEMQNDSGGRMAADVFPAGNNDQSFFSAKLMINGNFSEYHRGFLLLRVFAVAALSRSIVVVHSSAVIYDGKAILFLGESGTGKSTHTRLWLDNIPDTELMNDDSPLVRVEDDGSVRAYGAPWSGKAVCYKNIVAPLAAVVRLEQAPCNRIRRMTGAEAVGTLFPSTPYSFHFDPELSDRITDITACILERTPAYHLECLPNADAARLVRETLRKDGRL